MSGKKQLTFSTCWTAIYYFVFNFLCGVFPLNLFDIFFAISWVFLLFLIATYSRIFFFITIPTVFMTSGVVVYTEWLMHTPIPRPVVSSAFSTSLRIIQGSIGEQLYLWFGFSLILTILCVWHFLHLKIKHHWVVKFILTTGFITVFVFCVFMVFPPRYGIVLHWQHPYDYLEYTVSYIREYFAQSKLENKYDISTLPITREYDKNDPPLQVVVVIGEAARADHFGIYSYSRDTTPRLRSETNVIAYNDVTSCATITMVSVPCMATRATRDDLDPSKKETSFVSVFKRAGFETLWVSEQPKYSGLTTLVASIANESETKIFQDNNLSLRNIDFKDYFVNDLKSSNKDKLAVFHMLGAHFPYHWMYPMEFRRFVPTCPDVIPQECPHDALINSYDNTTVFTDYFLANVIEALRDKNAIMVYVSDHGEYLGEHGMFLHGQETTDREVRHVPMIWWVSDEFIRLHPEKVSNMQKKRLDKLSHDNLFHSILDCGGINSPVVDDSLSLC